MPSHSLLLFLLFGGAASRRYNEMQLDFIVYSAKGTQRKRKSELKSQVKRSCALQWVGMDNNATDKKKSSSQENQKAKMRLDEKISSVAFGRLTKIDADKNVPRIRVCVLGSAAVGKTGKFHCLARVRMTFIPIKKKNGAFILIKMLFNNHDTAFVRNLRLVSLCCLATRMRRSSPAD